MNEDPYVMDKKCVESIEVEKLELESVREFANISKDFLY